MAHSMLRFQDINELRWHLENYLHTLGHPDDPRFDQEEEIAAIMDGMATLGWPGAEDLKNGLNLHDEWSINGENLTSLSVLEDLIRKGTSLERDHARTDRHSPDHGADPTSVPAPAG